MVNESDWNHSRGIFVTEPPSGASVSLSLIQKVSSAIMKWISVPRRIMGRPFFLHFFFILFNRKRERERDRNHIIMGIPPCDTRGNIYNSDRYGTSRLMVNSGWMGDIGQFFPTIIFMWLLMEFTREIRIRGRGRRQHSRRGIGFCSKTAKTHSRDKRLPILQRPSICSDV